MVIIILTSICVVVSDGVSPFAVTLLSSIMTLPVPYGSSGGYDGLLVVLNIKPGVYSLGDYGPNTYSLPT